MARKSSVSKEKLLECLKTLSEERGGFVKASVKEMAGWVGGSVPTISKYLDELEQEGYLTVKRGHPASYSVNEWPVGKAANGSPAAGRGELDRLASFAREMAPMVTEFMNAVNAAQELQELKAFKDSLTVVYEGDGVVFYKRELPKAQTEPVPAPDAAVE